MALRVVGSNPIIHPNKKPRSGGAFLFLPMQSVSSTPDRTSYSSPGHIFRIAWPILVGSLAQNIIGITDTAFMGRVGETELAAAAIGGIYFFVLYMMGYSFSNGMQIIVARRSGEQRPDAIGKTFDHALYIVAGVIVFQWFNLAYLTPRLLGLLVSNDAIRDRALDFLHYRGLGIFFTILNSCFLCFFVGIGKTFVINFTTLTLCLVNVGMAWLLVFGHAGLHPMGIRGAGLASALADASVTLVYLIYLFRLGYKKIYGLFRFRSFDTSLIRKMLKLSLPIFFQQLITMSTWFGFFIFIEHRGQRSLAVSNIIKSIYIFIGIPTWALAQTTNTMVSNLLGQKKPEEVIPLLRRIVRMNLLVALFICLLLVLLRSTVLRLFTNDLQVIHDAWPVYPVIMTASFLSSISLLCLFAVTGTGSSSWALFAEIISITLYLLYVYLTAIVLQCSLPAIWGAEVVYWTVAFCLSAGFLRWGPWRENKL